MWKWWLRVPQRPAWSFAVGEAVTVVPIVFKSSTYWELQRTLSPSRIHLGFIDLEWTLWRLAWQEPVFRCLVVLGCRNVRGSGVCGFRSEVRYTFVSGKENKIRILNGSNTPCDLADQIWNWVEWENRPEPTIRPSLCPNHINEDSARSGMPSILFAWW